MRGLDAVRSYRKNAIRFHMPRTEIRLFRTGANGTTPILDWLAYLEVREPRAYHKCLERVLVLSHLGSELRRPHVDMLRDGIRELRFRVGTVQYRILYAFCGANIAFLSHGFTKEGDIPDSEIDLAVKRKKLVEHDPDKYTAEWGE